MVAFFAFYNHDCLVQGKKLRASGETAHRLCAALFQSLTGLLLRGTIVTLPPSALTLHYFEPFQFTAGDQLMVPIGASHISLPLQEIQSREWGKKKNNTNNTSLRLTQVQKGVM